MLDRLLAKLHIPSFAAGIAIMVVLMSALEVLFYVLGGSR